MSESEPLRSVTAESPPAVPGVRVAPAKAAAKLELLDGDEVIQLSIKPSLWFIPLVAAKWVLAMALLAAGVAVVMREGWTREGLIVFQLLIGVAAIRVGVATLQWASRLYVLTNRRVMRFKGILSVDVAERRLAQIGQIKLHIPRYGHALRLGSILMQLAEHDSTPLWWDDVARPHEIHEILERAIRKAQT
ncbi:MAG TPA: PH domain-containing protein [Phycisphaerae bacterium]|nr:PH domain-containing protein [Phycisphaerae bacterium]HQL55069.1 PH domain-containing protein [Phycisphaerae bacterium]